VTFEATVFNCPTCGASLDASFKRGNAKCPYCGNTITVSQSITVEDLAAEQAELINNSMQSAMELSSKQTAAAAGILKTTVPVIFGGTVIVPLLITAVTFIFIICIFGFVFLSFAPVFSMFR
jgi:DNA-directed RNA polymerase subunit RPC12/RpoP